MKTRAGVLLRGYVHLVVLVGSHSRELSAREDEGLPSVPVEAVDVV